MHEAGDDAHDRREEQDAQDDRQQMRFPGMASVVVIVLVEAPPPMQMVRRLAAERSTGRRGDERDHDKRKGKYEGVANATTRRRARGSWRRRVHFPVESDGYVSLVLGHRCPGRRRLEG